MKRPTLFADLMGLFRDWRASVRNRDRCGWDNPATGTDLMSKMNEAASARRRKRLPS